MKKLLLCVSLFAANAVVAGSAFAAEPSPACTAKRVSIETRISEATAQGRKQQLNGLNKALRANKANCTDASLAKDRDRDIKAAQKKVASREKDLMAAEKKGDAAKVASRKAKLDEARTALSQAEKPITQ